MAATTENVRNITIGADPELLVKDENGKPHHCIGMIGGDKWNPVPVLEGAIQEDNVAFEFNIDPCTTAMEFSDRIDLVMKQGLKMLPEGYTLHAIASHSFKDIDTFPEESLVFGCMPDHNALDGTQNPRPFSKDKNLRSFGGHVHIGWTDVPVSEETQCATVLACDCLLGLWSVAVDRDKKRRELYGKAGAYRAKSFGVEYRTLSNFWVGSALDRIEVFHLAVLAANYNNYDKIYKLLNGVDMYEVHDVINKGNVKRSREMFKQIMKGIK